MKDFPFVHSALETGVITLTRESGEEIPVTFRILSSRQPVEGIEALVQMVIKGLLDSPGSNVFTPYFGVGLADLVGVAVDPTAVSSLIADITLFVHNLEQRIKEIQMTISDLKDEEKLESLRIRNCNISGDRLVLDIDIITAAGDLFPLEVRI